MAGSILHATTLETSPSLSQNRYIGPGLVGLENLGNSCYFKCLSNTEAFTDYFILAENWRQDLNIKNKVGKNGDYAMYYGNLINEMWDKQSNNKRSNYTQKIIGNVEKTR